VSEISPTRALTWNRRFGAHVEASRNRAGLTRAELAYRMRVSEETVRRWERGGSQPSDDNLAHLIAVLAMDGSALKLDSPAGEDDLPPLARRLRAERADRRITQAQAGAFLGVAQPTYAGWEVGRSTPDASHLHRIAEFLGVDADEAAALTEVPFVVDADAWPELGRILGRRRQALRLTREQLAQKVGVTRSTIVNWELGYRVPRVQQLSLLASALDVGVSELERALPAGSRPLTALGNIVRSRQGTLGLTRAEIARRAGTDEATLSRWVHGHRRPDESGLRRLAAVLDVPLGVVAEAAGLAGPPTLRARCVRFS
jgi:transcriptional regulator with XRE-family HTH domain